MTIGSLDIFPQTGGNINSLTGYPLTVPHGGTGVTSLAQGILLGNGTGPIISQALTNGQILIGSTGMNPQASTLTAGSGILITHGAGIITIAASGVASTFIADIGVANPIGGNINIVGLPGSSIRTSAAADFVFIDSTGGGLPWQDTTSSTSMVPNTGYVPDAAGLITLTLPPIAAFGDVIRVAGNGSGGWKIAQHAGQFIAIGSDSTSVGVGGSLSSTNRNDCVELLCVVGGSSAQFVVLSSMGNITVV